MLISTITRQRGENEARLKAKKSHSRKKSARKGGSGRSIY